MSTRRVRDPGRPALVAIAKDAVTAEQWRRLLAAEGIEAQVRIEEPERAGMPGRMNYPFGRADVLSMFSYAVYVAARDRRAARALLAERSGLGPMPVNRTAVIGAATVVALTMLLVVALVLRG